MALGKWLTRDAAPAPTLVRQSAAMDSFLFDLRAAEESGAIAGDYYRGFMSIPGVERAATLIASLLGGLKWEAYRDRGDNPITKLAPIPFLMDPCPPLTRFDVISSLALDYMFHGIAFAVITDRDRNNQPTAYMPVPAWSVQVMTFTDLPYYLTPPSLRLYRIGGLELAESDLIRICSPQGPGALRGQGVIERHFSTMNLAREMNKQALAIVREGGVPTGIVSDENPDATEEDVTALRGAWLDRMKYRGVAFTNGQVKWTPVSWNPTDAQLIEARQFSLTEISLIFGLPGHFLQAPGAGDGLKYSTVAMEADELLKFGKPAEMISAFEQAFTRKLPNGTECVADFSNLLRMDDQARAVIHNLGITGGWKLRSEIRDEELLPPIPGIDDEPEPPVEQALITALQAAPAAPANPLPPLPPAPKSSTAKDAAAANMASDDTEGDS